MYLYFIWSIYSIAKTFRIILGSTLGGNKVSLLTHTYPYKPLRMDYGGQLYNHQGTQPI